MLESLKLELVVNIELKVNHLLCYLILADISLHRGPWLQAPGRAAASAAHLRVLHHGGRHGLPPPAAAAPARGRGNRQRHGAGLGSRSGRGRCGGSGPAALPRRQPPPQGFSRAKAGRRGGASARLPVVPGLAGSSPAAWGSWSPVRRCCCCGGGNAITDSASGTELSLICYYGVQSDSYPGEPGLV